MAAITMMFLFVISEALAADPPLQSYNVDGSQLSVSGASSGACMATQLHVIFSKHFMGAGIIAGVPYACSDGNLAGATKCMVTPSLESVTFYEQLTSTAALYGNVDTTSNMANDKVYIFAGTQDTVINPGNGWNIAKFYSHFIPNNGNIKEVSNVRAEHCMPTDNYGGPCDKLNTASYLNNCGYNAAFELLNHTYGGHLHKLSLTSSSPPAGQLIKFDQSEFFHLNPPSTYGMDTTGYIFVPSGCLGKTSKCKLHVALHGCEMGRTVIGDTYVRHAGYNEVGEANNIIIMYPQAIKTVTNPNGCWDWWGFTGPLFATNKGFQIQGIRRMLERAMGGW